MKVMWLGGIVLPRIAVQEKLPVNNMNGWLIKLSESIGHVENINLTYVFDSERKIVGSTNYYCYFGVKNRKPSYKRVDNEYIRQMKEILESVKPDIIHIWGTERSHTLGMVQACKELGIEDKIVISIQGLVSAYSYHYTGYLPAKVVYGLTIRDLIQGNIAKGQRRFKTRGKYECEAIQSVQHVIGRTDWDRACTWNVNPNVNYHFNNETLRDEFYTNVWSHDSCEKYSVFCSQSHYPIKGGHLVIEAFERVVKEYPSAHLYIGGKDYLKEPAWKRTSYAKYIIALIKEKHLENSVSFTGFLNATEMKQRYLKSNVFVSASSIENSPNSLGEAMLLGVPCVSSNVGGVNNLLTHGLEGYLYPADEVYMLSYYICDLFKNIDKAIQFGKNARKHALVTHDAEKNQDDLLKIYNSIFGKG